MHLFIYRNAQHHRDAALVPDEDAKNYKEEFLLEPDSDWIIEVEAKLDLNQWDEKALQSLRLIDEVTEAGAGRGYKEIIERLILIGVEHGAKLAK